jgi:vitamin B12 transporter
MVFRRMLSFSLLMVFTLSFAASALAMTEEDKKDFMKMSEEEREVLLMYFAEDELYVVSTTRSLKSISRVAENVEVVTAADIKLMNAHTLAQVLNTVNGVVVNFSGGSPGAIATVDIQGSNDRDVMVFLDGVPYNNLPDSLSDVGEIPVQFIDRIEIIKGPASSAWGSSLGGIINIITKSPAKTAVAGVVSASYGERDTWDYRAEVSGTLDKFGYLFSAGRLTTDGLRTREAAFQNSVYSKLSYDILPGTNLIFSLFYSKNDREAGDVSAYDLSIDRSAENLISSLTLNSAISRDLDLNVSLRAASQTADNYLTVLSSGDEIPTYYDDKKYGGSVKLTWRLPNNDIVFGSDYDYGIAESNTFFSHELILRKLAFYVNDTVQLGRFSLTPGLRYDNTNVGGDFVSPSFGVAFQLRKDTVLRGIIARGFNVPQLSATDADSQYFRHNSDLEMEKVWSYQAGIESSLLNWLWVKFSGFRHDLTDAIVKKDLPKDMFTYENRGKVRRQGVEAEVRTPAFYHISLFAGAMVMETKDLKTDESIKEIPTYTYDVGLKYDDEKSLKALLTGRRIWWNEPADFKAEYNAVIFDFNLAKSFYLKNGQVIELFLTAHNLFNGAQYWIDVYKNAGRWFEAGLRFNF